jgi:TrmH family RNA methyltransferase
LKLLTLARDLRRRRARERQRLFVAEGVRAVAELLDSALTVRGVLVSPTEAAAPRAAAHLDAGRQRGVEILEVSDR